MSVSFECVKCEADFELEIGDIVRDTSLLKCPNCGAKANANIVENVFLALEEFMEQLQRLRRKFRVGLSIEFDEFGEDQEEEFVEEDDDGDAFWGDDPEEDDDP